jgi:hypothetical protein
LEATVRQLQRFRSESTLAPELIDQLQEQVVARRAQLTGRKPAAKPGVTPVAPSAPAEEPPPSPPPIPKPEPSPVRQLQELLTAQGTADELSAVDRERALALYRQARMHIADLAPEAQLALARLFKRTSQIPEALEVYRRWLTTATEGSAFGAVALEAGRLALDLGNPLQARWFTNLALERSPGPDVRSEAEALLQSIFGGAPEAAGTPASPVEASQPAAAPPSVERRTEPPTPSPPPRAPRRSLVELLAAFMEQRNILWGELVGGLLIVGCSIALVISLWKTLEENQYQYGIFVAVTAALFGAGLYTLSHWKLESTSRGLLVIATLLVPLNLLAITTAQLQSEGDRLPVIVTEVAALAVFGLLLSLAAKVLAPEGRWAFTVAILGISASQLLIPRLLPSLDATTWLPILLAGGLPVAFQVLCTGSVLYRTACRGPLQDASVKALFTLLGIATFALAVALGLLVFWCIYRGSNLNLALQHVAILVAVGAMPVLVGGLQMHQGLAGVPEAAGYRTTGTATALTGMVVMLAAVGLAWPHPHAVAAISTVDFAVLTWVAFRYQLPVAHAVALPCLLLGYLAGWHLLPGWLGEEAVLNAGLALSADSGKVLVGLVLLLAVAAELLSRLGLSPHNLFYAAGSAGAALISLIGVTLPVQEAGAVTAPAPAVALVVYGVYGITALAVNGRWRRSLLTSVGVALLTCATLWGLRWLCYEPEQVPLWGSVLAAESLLLGVVAVLLGHPRPGPSAFAEPLARSGEAVTLVAIGAALWGGLTTLAWSGEQVVTGACLFGLYLLLAAVEARGFLARLAGLLLIITAAVAAGWAVTVAEVTEITAWIALCIATASTLMAAVAVWAANRETPTAWYRVLTRAWLETAIVAGILSLVLVGLGTSIPKSPLPTYIGVLVTATALLLAWGYHTPVLTWVGSMLALGTITYGLRQASDLHFPTPLLDIALLSHATLVLLVGEASALARGSRLNHLVVKPFSQSGLASSCVALPLLVLNGSPLVEPALGLFWLAALWLGIALVRRWPVLFTAFQAVLSLAVMFATAAWLEQQDWFLDLPGWIDRWGDPRSLQAFGLGLGGLSLLWVGTRIGLQSNETARPFLAPGWPGVDRLVLVFLVAGQLALAILGILPAVANELSGGDLGEVLSAWPAAILPYAHRGGAWTLLALLAIVLLMALWERWAQAAVLGLVILGLSVPLLGAGAFEATRATVPALRWGLAGCFLLVSALLWGRAALDRLARQLHCLVHPATLLPPVIRSLLIGGAVAPMLVLTILDAMSDLGGRLLHPDASSFFGRMPWLLAALGPLVLVSLGLVGHALRERSPAYAFGAGLVVNLAVTGGQALVYLKSPGPLNEEMLTQLAVLLCQWFTVTAAGWAIAWLAARPWLLGRADQPESPLAQPLLKAQLSFGVAGNVGLIGLALWLITVAFPETSAWALEEGSPLGWVALVTTAAAAAGHRLQRRTAISLKVLGLIGLAAIGLLACSIERGWPGDGWGYRTVMLGWAVYPLIWVLAVSDWLPKPAGESLASAWTDAAMFWVHGAGVLAFLLSLKVAFWHQEQLWAAGAIALISPAWAVTALWRRREEEAFTAGLGVNLAASLVVWHFHAQTLADWWVHLLQANVIAGSLVTLLWLGLRKRMYRGPELRIQSAPFLAFQTAGLLIVNVVLLVAPAVLLVLQPAGPLPVSVLQVGEVWGWLALVLAALATAWYSWQVVPWSLVHLCRGLGLGLGALAACSVSRAEGADWWAYHLLMLWWMLIGLATLAHGWTWSFRPCREIPTPAAVDDYLVPWVRGIGLAVVLLAIRGAWAFDPANPYWSAGSTLMISALIGVLAFWSRRPFDVYVSGLLLNVVGTLVWVEWGDRSWSSLVFVQVLSLAVASSLWTILELGLQRLAPPVDLRGRWLPFAHVAITLASGVLGVVVVWAVLFSLMDLEPWATGALVWGALAATASALALLLWDRTARFPLGGLYAVGLMALGLALHGANLAPRDFSWTAPLTLAPYVLLTAGIARLPKLGQVLRLPDRPAGWSLTWYVPAQLSVAGVVVALSVWMALDFPAWTARLAGPAAAAILLPAGVLLAGPLTARLQFTTLALGVAVVTEMGWAFLDPAGHQPSWLWLHRNVHLMGALALLTVLYGFGLPRWLPRSTSWGETSRRIGPGLGVLASLLVPVILLQEGVLFEGRQILAALREMMDAQPAGLQAAELPAVEPMALLGVAAVAVALLGLIGAGLSFAMLPGRDPLGLSERGRQWYVYGAEVLLVLLFVHFRLTRPELFKLGLFKEYWPFLLMVLAFAGAGLSEFFHRRGLPVLAEPLERTGVFLPLLPVLAIWMLPAGRYAFLCFLAGLLYGLLSVTKRSFRFALLAALVANLGLWVMLHHHEIYFFQHPQLWLIPFALVILVAEHLNRDRLPPAQGAALRYLALMVIYISSTADMFIAGLGESVVWPLVLAVLSVLGVLAGMLLRVRAFLFLGVTFLVVVILTMIWHAGVDRHHTWILWSAGIVLGVAILTLFGIFEKRRNEVLQLVEELKQWD